MVFWSALFVLAAAAAMEKEVGRVVRPDGILPRTRDADEVQRRLSVRCRVGGARGRGRGEGLPIRRFLWDRRLLFLHAGLAAGLFADRPTSFWSGAGSVRSC